MSTSQDKARTFQELCPDLWLAKTQVGWFPCYCLAIKGASNWVIYGAGVNLCSAFVEQFGADAPVSHLVIPNSFHHLGIPEWKKIFPSAKLVSASPALARLKRQGVEESSPWQQCELPLPDEVSLLEPPHCKLGELWISLYPDRPERTLCVADAFFCLDKPQGLQSRLIQTASGISSSPAVSRLFKWSALSQRKAYYSWAVQTIRELDPQMLIPQHGQILRGNDVPARLLQALDERF